MGKLYDCYCKTYKLNKINSEGFFDIVGDLYFSDEVQSLAKYEQHLDINRLQHITGVAFLTYVICKRLGLNYRSAARGATMHDLFYYDWRDGETGKWHRLHGYKHPRYACLNAKELAADSDMITLNCIKRHMWPLTFIPPRYAEGYIVSFADKYCATRELMYSLSKKYKQRFLKDVERISHE